MTEEIIIDGVNVNSCRFFTENLFHPLTNSDCSAHCAPYPEGACYDTCDEHPDCYYKQLKRLEQENEKMKKYIIAVENDNDWLTALFEGATLQKYNDYRSALEEIREIADKCKECLNEDDDCGCDYLRIKRRIDEVLGDE